MSTKLDEMDLGETMKFVLDLCAAFPEGETFFVSEYVVSRDYGGPEEGGWWFDDWSFQRIVAIFSNEVDANMYANDRTEEASTTKKDNREQNRYSVIGSPDTIFHVESNPRQRETTERPHYC